MSKRLDTMLTHLCDSIEQCEVITNLQNADSLLSVRITRDSILSYKADSVLSTRIINDSVLFYKTDSVLLAHILNDSILSHQVDSILLARILSDSTNLANNYYTKDKINDTLSHYTTTDDVNSMLGDYATKDTLKNYLTIDGLCDSIKKCEVITNLQNADSVLSARIINDSVIFYKTDSVLLAHILNDSILSHQVDSILLARILSDSTNLANNYYTMGKINDTLSHYTTTDDINSLLGDYEKKSDLCNDVMNCAGIQTMQTNITNVANNLDSTKVNIRNEINNKVTNLQKADSVLGARITADSIRSYKADSVLSARITADSTNLANNYYNKDKINDTVRYILGQITSTSGSLSSDYYTKDEINDTLDHYTTSNSIDSLLRNYATKDTLKNYLTIDGLCDSIKKCDIISNLQNNVTNNTTKITNNTTNITNNTTNITNLMSSDSALKVRIHNDSVALSKRMDTLLTHICDSIEKCDIISNLQKSDSLLNVRITNDSIVFYKADSVLSARLVDTASKIRLALKDSLSRYLDSAQVRKEIHDSIGNGTLTITYGDNTPVTFTANQKTPSSIDIPAVPTSVAQLTDASQYAKVNGNTFTGTHDFTSENTTITVPSKFDIKNRPTSSTCTQDAVNICDLLAVFDSLSKRIKELEDDIAAINQPTTSAVSIELSEITKTSIKATATVSDPNLNVTSYKFCISENSSMSNPIICETVTSKEFTFTGLTPNTVYYATVKAFYSSGNDSSEVASGKTLPLTIDITISPASPVCLCDGNPTTVTYTANIEDANMDDYSFLWSVPDGNPLPDNPDERICTITYSVSASYKVTCTATLQANPTVQLTADTTVTVQNCTTPIITTCEADLTVTVMSVTGNPDFVDWNDGHTGTSVSKDSSNTYDNPGTYVIVVSQNGCAYEHKVALGDAALYPCTVSAAHTNTTEYTGSSTSPGTGGLETTDSEGKVTHVADQDGNIYPVVQIGSQCWMAKNLRTTHFSNGEEMSLSQIVENNTYDDMYDIPLRYKPALGMEYLSSWGYYYNWKAAMYNNGNVDPGQGVCPKGWHLPSKEEWETMATVVNGSEVVFPYADYAVQEGTLAGKLSSGCTWKPIYTEINSYPENVGQEEAPGDYNNPERNVSGFSSIPAGWISSSSPGWTEDNTYAYYWSSTLNPNNSASAYVLFWNHNYNGISCVPMAKYQSASSVRCLRDEMALTTYPTLSVTPSATSLLLCPGTSEDVTYTAAVIVNGETRTTDYSYTWSVTNTKTNTTTTLENHTYQVTITYSDSANYKVSCVAANSNTSEDAATNSVMMLVRLKVAPSFTIQDPSGFTVTLNNITNTNQIVWDNNNANTTTENLSGNQTSATHTYGAAGSYQITAYSAGNCSLTQTVGIQVSVVLNSSNNTAFCPNSSTTVTYTATVDGAEASGYSWTVEKTSGNAGGFAPAQSSGSSNSFEVTYNATGTYTVSCTATLVGGGSLGKATTTTITANEAPVFNTCVDGKWLTVSGMSNVATIHWTLSGTGESVDTDDPLRSHNYDDNESDYSIKVLSSAGCEATASGDLGTTPSTYCHVQTVDQANEEYNGDKLLRVKDNAINETNWYSVVQIGSQCWMAENLRTNNTSSGGWQDPRYNNTYYRSKFGRLYERESALSSCPTGWHLPSLAEWEQMESVVSGSTISHSSTNYVGTHAGLLAGVCDWTSSDVTSSPGNHAQNTYGFRVLPAGNRNISSYSSVDYHLGEYASFWCSDEGGVAWTMKFNEAGTKKDESVPESNYYISVRCVRDGAAVLPTPTMSITPNDENVSFCPENSQNVSYTASLTLDNQPVACNSYVWSVTSEDAEGFTAIQQNTQTSSFEMTYSIPGHYTVSCTATPSGYNSANTSVTTTVSYKTAPTFNEPTVSGRTVKLTGVANTTSIAWGDGVTTTEGIGTTVSHTYSANSTGDGYHIIATNSSTGCVKEVDVPVSLTMNITPTGNTGICTGGNTEVSYTAEVNDNGTMPATGYEYTWSLSSTDGAALFNTTGSTVTVTYSAANTYTVSCTANKSTEYVSNSVETQITALATPDFTTPVSVSGATVTLNDLTNTDQVVWDNNNVSTTTEDLVGSPTSAEHTYTGTPGEYHYTIVATNTTTGCSKTVENVEVTIPTVPPTQTESPEISDITTTSMTVTPHFSGAISSYTYCISTNNDMTEATCHAGEAAYSFNGLQENTTYYVQVTATNAGGSTLSDIVSAKTLASSGGGGNNSVDLKYSCIVSGSLPSETLPSPMSEWSNNNEKGRTFGNPVVVTVLDSVSDYEGHWYKVVQIGTQCWLKENMRATRYSSGQHSIVNNNNYFFPSGDNSNSNVKTYGLIYNFTGATNGSSTYNEASSYVQGICPSGWHVPGDHEWKALLKSVNGNETLTINSSAYNYTIYDVDVRLLVDGDWKVNNNTCNNYPCDDNSEYRNKLGFSALPAGWRTYQGTGGFQENASFWSSYASSDIRHICSMKYDQLGVGIRNFSTANGASVRCVRD